MSATPEKIGARQGAHDWLGKVWSQRGVREKTVIGSAVAVAVLLLLNQFVINPFIKDQERVQNEIPVQQQVLAKYAQMAASRPEMQKRLQDLTAMRQSLHNRLLEGQTPALAAAGLQDMLQKLATQYEVSVQVMRVLQPRPLEMYTGVQVLIEVQTRIPGLTAFLYGIENNPKLLRVGKLSIRVIDLRKPMDVRASLMVEGYSLAPQPKPAATPARRSGASSP